MAKKRTKIMLTYVITIIVTVIVIFIVALFLVKKVQSEYGNMGGNLDSMIPETEYVPSVLDNQTGLFILDGGDRMTASVFVLIRMVPSERRIVVLPIQSDSYAVTPFGEGTIYELYKEDGVQGAKRAVESICGVVVEKYMTFTKTSFEKMAAQFEMVNYVFPYSLIYEDEKTGEVTVIREGNCSLDPASMRKAFIYPEYKSGETTRNAFVGAVVTDMLNATQPRFQSGLDPIIRGVLSCGAETDITELDYDKKRDAMQYMAEKSSGCAELVLPSGEYDEEGRYIIESDFKRTLRSWFSLDMYDTQEVPADKVTETAVPQRKGLLPEAYSAEVLR